MVAVELPFIPTAIDCMHQTIKTYLEREHSILLFVTRTLYVYRVCHGMWWCRSLCKRWELFFIKPGVKVGWTVLMGYLTISTNVRRYQTHHRWHFFLSGRQRVGAHALCVQHSPTAAALSTSFLLNHAHNSPELKALVTRFRGHTAAWVLLWVKKTEEIKDRLVEFWQCTDTAFEWKKMRFSCFPVFRGNAEARVIWDGKVKRLLIAYFIGNISAKNYQNAFTYVRVIANRRCDVFLRHTVLYRD